MSVDPNRLLFVISACGSMTWAQYCEAVDLLLGSGSGRSHAMERTATRSGLLQCFQALGHCDALYEMGESAITVAPPALARLPRAGLPVAVLAGARCPQTRNQMAEAAQARTGAVQLNVEHRPGPVGLLPDTILVKAESEDAMVAFCADLNLRYAAIPPAWTLVNWCGTLPEYETTLDYRIPETLNWARYDFNVNSFVFIRTTSDSLPRFSRYRNPTTGLPIHVFFRDGLGAEADLNWGRYLLLNSKGITVTAYDEKRFRLCVPVKTPLPAVVARTVCLCSGKPPVRQSKDFLMCGLDCQDWLMFEDVPPQIAVAALSKVGQSPARVEI
ncbi:MAG: hypothetical protein U9N46_06410 [Euryarchaeota archaeon]|nr:hypothetical protein [Euryarchaeota archaeon]